MLKINIDTAPNQIISIPFEDEIITLHLKYLDNLWICNVTYKEKSIYGLKLSSGCFICDGQNYPFDFWIDDKGEGIDPYTIDDFNEGYFDFLLVERDEMEELRGHSVE